MKDLPKWFSLGLPLGTLAFVLLMPLAGHDWWYALVDRKEFSVLEIGTVAFLLPAVAIGLLAARRYARSPGLPRKRLAVVFLIVMSAGALYFGGEEISWGQTYFRWKTPARIAALNKQKETNLHNISRKKHPVLGNLLNNVPRQGLMISIIVGGAVLPLVLRKRRDAAGADQALWNWLVPTTRLVPVSVMAALIGLPEDVFRSLERSGTFELVRSGYVSRAFVQAAGEFKEYLFGLAILMYLLSTWLRLRARAASPIAP